MLGYCKVLWNYLEMNCVSNSCNLWVFYVLPLCQDMWLPGDYLARYYSLCDIGILAPIFVTARSSVFVTAYELRLCDNVEFHLCDGKLVPAVCQQWVSYLWWHCHVALGWIFWFWNGVLLLLTVYILCSLMLKYFEKVWCYII